ncbi:MAG: hypothetical protein ACRELY_28500 [Polyangiaceae bacterium]
MLAARVCPEAHVQSAGVPGAAQVLDGSLEALLVAVDDGLLLLVPLLFEPLSCAAPASASP